jgi:hypothetical protein
MTVKRFISPRIPSRQYLRLHPQPKWTLRGVKVMAGWASKRLVSAATRLHHKYVRRRQLHKKHDKVRNLVHMGTVDDHIEHCCVVFESAGGAMNNQYPCYCAF